MIFEAGQVETPQPQDEDDAFLGELEAKQILNAYKHLSCEDSSLSEITNIP